MPNVSSSSFLFSGQTYYVDSTANVIAVDGELTLAEALAASSSDMAVGDAPAGGTNDQILFAPELAGSTIEVSQTTTIGSGSQLLFYGDADQDGTADVTVRMAADSSAAAGAGTPSEHVGRHFNVETGGTLILDGISLAAGSVAGNGGAIFNEGDLTLIDVALTENSAARGGAIYNSGEVQTLNSSFVGNQATGNGVGDGGGAIFNADGTLKLTGSTFTNNSALGDFGTGGAISSVDGFARLINGTMTMNSAFFAGGAVSGSANALFDMRGIVWSENSALAPNGSGGALHFDDTTTANLTGTFTLNEAADDGGALWMGSQTAAILYSGRFEANVAGDSGGAIQLENGVQLLAATLEFDGNTAVRNSNIGIDGSTSGDGSFNLRNPSGLGNEPVTGGSQSDVLDGDEEANTLSGGGGNDLLRGGSGDDTLEGGAGEDTLDGGIGSDTMSGGADNDVYVVDSSSDIVFELEGEGLDAIYTTAETTGMGGNVEYLLMQGGAVTAFGNSGDNVIYGNDADNTIYSGQGLDIMYGFGGEDTFVIQAIDQGETIEQQIIVGFEGAGVEGGDSIMLAGFGEGATLVQVSTESYQVRDANNETQAQFWLYQGDGVLNESDYSETDSQNAGFLFPAPLVDLGNTHEDGFTHPIPGIDFPLPEDYFILS